MQRRKLAEAVETVEVSVAEKLPDELAEFLSSMQVKAFPKLSSIELDDIRIPGMYSILLCEERTSQIDQDSIFNCGHESMDWTSDVGPSSGIYHEK